MILKPSVVLMCVMALGCANIQQMESGRAIKTAPTTSAVTYHHLKWITNQTKFPIEMSVPIPVEQEQQQTAAPTAVSTTSFWNWLRLNDYQWVSKMKELLKSFLVTETRDRATLMVLNYDNRTHEQLGSYEPKMMRASENSPRERVIELASGIMSNKRDIFTLAYLKDHYIKTEKFPDRIKVTCYADFLIANTTMVDTIMSLMERYASFKMAVKSTQTNWAGPAPGPRFSSHNRNHVRPFEVRRPSTQEQEQEQQQQQQQQYEELQRQQIRQQQIQEIQRLQQQQQLSQQLQQIQRQWQQHQLKQMQQQQQQQQQEQLPITLQSFLEKMISYQSPPPELLEHDRLVQQQSQQQFMQPIQLVQVTQKQTSQPPVFKPAEKILVDAQQKQKAEKEQEVGSQKDQPSPQQPTGSAQQASQQSQQQQQQQQQQKQQQDKQLQAQGTTQYQQLYHPVHQPTMMLPMSNYPVVSNFHPAVYQNDLVNFYSSLFNPSPVSFSHPKILIQQQQQQLQPLQQTEQQQPELQQPKQQQQQQPTMQPPSSQIVTMSLPLQPSQPNQLYPNMAFVLPQTPYEYLFNPRLGKREVRSSMVSSDDENDGKYDYEQDYDESRFLKIRLSLGPISIYRPFENEEAVSCSLNLVNIDTLLSDYQNKIIETIDTSEYNPNQEDEEFDEKQEQTPEHNDLMFMIDGKNADPTAEIKKIKTPKQQEETMNKVSDKSVAELIEMERQMNKVTSASTPRVAFSSLTAIICVFITFFF